MPNSWARRASAAAVVSGRRTVSAFFAGRSPQTPVGVFARVTRPDAQAAVGTLVHLPDVVAKIDGGPAILIIGDVVAHSAPWRLANPNLADHFNSTVNFF